MIHARPTEDTLPGTVGDRQSVDFLHEVRLAVVMYGGVSLAVYMSGVARELLAMVRATAPGDSSDPVTARSALLSSDDFATGGTEIAYRLAAFVLGQPTMPPERLSELANGLESGMPPHAPPLQHRFVVDILSGTSAGGLNAVFLAKALVREASNLDSLGQVWLKEGSFAALIDDAQAGQHDPAFDPPLSPSSPAVSMLSGRRMYRVLKDALSTVTGPGTGDSSHYVNRLDLSVTATDVIGAIAPIALSNGAVLERRHRKVFRFGFVDNTSASPRNDFLFDGATDAGTATNPAAPLTFAARCTSSFPFAFPPISLESTSDSGAESPEGLFRRWFPEYTAAEYKAVRYFDGGVLDNKPFTGATSGLLHREARLPVERTLLYVEPDPEALQASAETSSVNALDAVLAATFGIPTYETIREDLTAIGERNRQIERTRTLLNSIDQRIVEDNALANDPDPDAIWLRNAQPSAASAELPDPPLPSTYLPLRIQLAIDSLVGLLSRAAEVVEESDAPRAIESIVKAWRVSEADDDRVFLERYDLPFRMRRIVHLLSMVEGWQERPETPANVQARLRDVRAGLWGAADDLLGTEAWLARRDGPIRELIREVGITSRAVGALLEEGSDGDTARDIVAKPEFRQGAEIVGDELKRAGMRAWAWCDQAISSLRAVVPNDPQMTSDLEQRARTLELHLKRFERVDAVVLPITFGTPLAEEAPVQVRRVSPVGGSLRTRIPAERRSTGVLAGRTLNHFGAFLEAEWRAHDMAWGRLDGVEQIVEALLPSPRFEAHRAEIVAIAQRRIIASEFAPPQDVDPIDWFLQAYEVRGEPESDEALRTFGRASQTTGTVLDGILRPASGVPSTLQQRLGFAVGRAFWRATFNHHLPTWPFVVAGLSFVFSIPLTLAAWLCSSAAIDRGWSLAAVGLSALAIAAWSLAALAAGLGIICIIARLGLSRAARAVRNAIMKWLQQNTRLDRT
jgi:patatin-related protein